MLTHCGVYCRICDKYFHNAEFIAVFVANIKMDDCNDRTDYIPSVLGSSIPISWPIGVRPEILRAVSQKSRIFPELPTLGQFPSSTGPVESGVYFISKKHSLKLLLPLLVDREINDF